MGVQAVKEQGHSRSGGVAPLRSPLSNRIRHGRALNAVAAYLRGSLRVPLIYLEPRIRIGTSSVDVLAVDAAGSGDIHIVETKVPNNFVTSLTNLRAYMQALRNVPSHYKWIVLPDTPAVQKLASHPSLFSPNGLGRVGVLLVREGHNPSDIPDIFPVIRAERFRVASDDLTRVEKFIDSHKPDIEVRV